MLCGIRCIDGNKVFADECEKHEAPFHCPKCKGELILRKGRIKVHHFSHKPPYNCQHGVGETEQHRKCKVSIYYELLEYRNVNSVEIEKDFGSVVADIYCEIKGKPVAIEVQRSNLSVNEIIERTEKYKELGVSVLWLAIHNENLNKEKYSPKAWEKWCHAVYFGRVYYWLSDITILPVHFSEYEIYVEETSWYEPGGVEQYAGGYHKKSKRYRTPLEGQKLNLVHDFSPTNRKSWSGGPIYVPDCYIFQDKYKKWW